MNTELIRKAVEYAEGWSQVGDVIFYPGSAIHGKGSSVWNLHTIYKDALAAQLVRQIDAAGGEVWPRNSTTYFLFQDGCTAIKVEGPDRTMNTIKACVEFYDKRKDDE